MRKMLSILCAFTVAAGAAITAYSAVPEDEKEYTSDGGYFWVNGYNELTYTDTTGTRYEYFYRSDTNSISLKFMNSQTGDAIVPSEINGIPVTSLSGRDGNKSSLENLVIPDTVTTISFFSGYHELKSVKLSSSLTEIEQECFKDCVLLESIEIPSSVKTIGEKAFSDCGSLKEITLNEGLEKLERGAFVLCPIESIVIPSTVKIIATGALSQTDLKSVTFKGTPQTIEERAFVSNEKLTEVNGLTREELVDNWDAFHGCAIQDSLIDEDDPFLIDSKGKLVAYVGTGTDVVLPDTVKTIGATAFQGKDITSITFPDSLTEIERLAFYQCEELTEITIPASVNSIGNMAFQNCYELKDVTFEYSDTMLQLGSSSFSFTLVSPETLVTNNRRYTNQNTAFENTYFDEDYTPILQPGDPRPEESETPSPEQTNAPEATYSPETTPSASPEPEKTITVMTSDAGVEVVIDGESVLFEDAHPFIDENGRTQIPIRAAAELLGCEVEWDGETQTVTITDGDDVITLVIGKMYLQKGQQITEMDTAPVIVNDRTYIPVRFAGEALGLEVNWNE